MPLVVDAVKKLLSLFLICVVGVPIGAVCTFLLAPFWGWFEAKSGIESLGHSGPASWCFVVVYVAVLVIAFAVRFLRPRVDSSRSRPDDKVGADR